VSVSSSAGTERRSPKKTSCADVFRSTACHRQMTRMRTTCRRKRSANLIHSLIDLRGFYRSV
jgi:hypothetical protein